MGEGSLSPPRNLSEYNYDIAYGKVAQNRVCQLGSKNAYFVSSCCKHVVASTAYAFNITINGTTLYNSLADWFFETNLLPHQLIDPTDCYCYFGVSDWQLQLNIY